MRNSNQQQIPVFMPALSALLLHAEDLKGEPLTCDEVLAIRDKAVCMMMPTDVARKLDERRGYRDIDPENCWYDWQHLRRELGRKPDLDPGPKFARISRFDPEYQRTIDDARASLERFRSMLPADGSPRPNAMLKTAISEGGDRALMWLSHVRHSGSGFVGQLFEVPSDFAQYTVGDEIDVPEESVLDWMVNDEGVLHGGFSIRYQRAQLPESERAAYDEYIGVKEYANETNPDKGAGMSF